MNIIKNSIAAIAISAVAILGLAGCSTGAASEVDSNAVVAEAPAEQTPPAQNELLKGFGEVITYEDGLSISISEPVEYVPTEYAAGADQAYQVLFTLTVTNGTDEPIDPIFYGSVSSGGVESSKIYDSNNSAGEVNFTPTTAILPGETITWLEARSIADPAKITVDFFVGYGYEDAIFTNLPV